MTKLYDTFGWFQFAVLNAPPEQAADTVSQLWLSQAAKPNRRALIKKIAEADARPIIRPLHLAASHHVSRVATPTAFMVLEAPGSNGTAALFTSSTGDGSNSLLHRMSEKISGEIFMFLADALPKFPNPMNFMNVINNFETTRIVRTMRDPGWDFFEKGKPLPFENTDYYRRPRIRDRVTPQILEEYVSKLGIGSFDEQVWINPNAEAIYLFQEEFKPTPDLPDDG
jgi:hypothetical protein